MLPRYTTNLEHCLHFDFQIEGVVEEKDIIGALIYHMSVQCPEYDLTVLQNTKKIGKIDLNIKIQQNNDSKDLYTRGSMYIPVNFDEYQSSIFTAHIEKVPQIKLYKAKIVLLDIEQLKTTNYVNILDRAFEIHNKYFRKRRPKISEIKKKFINMINGQIKTSDKNITIGPFAQKTPVLLVVEGRGDVVNLWDQERIGYTVGLGGYHFNKEEADQILKNKPKHQ